MMQLFRSLVTVIVVGTMAVMIFSLRSELAVAKFQVGRTMPEDKVLKVKAFLEAQTGVLTEFQN